MKICTTCGKEYSVDLSFCPEDGSALRSVAGSSDLLGSIIDGKYRINSKLGEGGMGAVYLADHVKMGRKCAVKVISKTMADDADSIARFNREAANASQINHPNVCAIYDYGETDDGLVFLVMEFIEGEALTDLLDREGALSPRRAAHILQQAGDALDAAHDLKIVHRDLKPDNIMIARARDGKDLVKVVDFGIAKAASGDTAQNVTKTGLVVGTPEYMSPEQLACDTVDGRSDTFSLGLVFFRMLTGVLPYKAQTSQEIMLMRLTHDPMRLLDALATGAFPDELQSAIDQALQRMPGDRYASAAQFGRDAVNAVKDLDDVAPPAVEDQPTVIMDSSNLTAMDTTADDGTEVIPRTRVSDQMRAPTPPTPIPAAISQVAAHRKRKPVTLITVAAGALIVGGAGLAIALSGGGGQPDLVDSAQPTDHPVTDVTATPPSEQERSQGVERPAAERNGRTFGDATENVVQSQTESAGAGDIDPTGQPVERGPDAANPAWMDVAAAGDHILDLLVRVIEAPGRNYNAIRDTALAYWDANGLPEKVRADAAYLAANVLMEAGDLNAAKTWIRRALEIDPADGAYQRLAAQLDSGRTP